MGQSPAQKVLNLFLRPVFFHLQCAKHDNSELKTHSPQLQLPTHNMLPTEPRLVILESVSKQIQTKQIVLENAVPEKKFHLRVLLNISRASGVSGIQIEQHQSSVQYAFGNLVF